DAALQDFSRSIVQAAADLDPSVPVNAAVSLEGRVAAALQGDRFNAFLLSSFAVVALVLAAVGIYGTIAYNVQARTRELGVRLALGAQPAGLLAATLYQAACFGVLGAGIGLAGAISIAVAVGDALYLVP